MNYYSINSSSCHSNSDSNSTLWGVANSNFTSWFKSSLSQKRQKGSMFTHTFICVFKMNTMTFPRLGWYFDVSWRKCGKIGTFHFLWQLNSPCPPSSFKTSLFTLFILPQPLTDALIPCSQIRERLCCSLWRGSS